MCRCKHDLQRALNERSTYGSRALTTVMDFSWCLRQSVCGERKKYEIFWDISHTGTERGAPGNLADTLGDLLHQTGDQSQFREVRAKCRQEGGNTEVVIISVRPSLI